MIEIRVRSHPHIPYTLYHIHDIFSALTAHVRVRGSSFFLKGCHTAAVNQEVFQERDLAPGKICPIFAKGTGIEIFCMCTHIEGLQLTVLDAGMLYKKNSNIRTLFADCAAFLISFVIYKPVFWFF